MIFNSLSKRSNAPGLRSGFAAGGPRSIAALRQLRAYGGAPLPLPVQRASDRPLAGRGPRHAPAAPSTSRSSPSPTACSAACPGYRRPEGGFFLWLDVGDGEAFALRLWRETGVRVLPGGYLGRATPGGENPGQRYIRVALVADAAEVERGLAAIRATLARLPRRRGKMQSPSRNNGCPSLRTSKHPSATADTLAHQPRKGRLDGHTAKPNAARR